MQSDHDWCCVLDGARDYCERVDVSAISLGRAFEQHRDDTAYGATRQRLHTRSRGLLMTRYQYLLLRKSSLTVKLCHVMIGYHHTHQMPSASTPGMCATALFGGFERGGFKSGGEGFASMVYCPGEFLHSLAACSSIPLPTAQIDQAGERFASSLRISSSSLDADLL